MKTIIERMKKANSGKYLLLCFDLDTKVKARFEKDLNIKIGEWN